MAFNWICYILENFHFNIFAPIVAGKATFDIFSPLLLGTQYDFVREFRRSTGTWHHTKPLLPSDLRRTGCAALRIANCKLFKLQLQQGLFRIRIPSVGPNGT